MRRILLILLLIFGCEEDVTEATPTHGCLDSQACNYDETATIDNNSCEYEYDCADICGGSSVIDECGECDGDGIAEDECDCDGNIEDCYGVCGGTAEDLGCGCGEAGPSGCDSKCGSTLANDECGVCGGSGMQVSYSEDCSYEYQCYWEWVSVPLNQCNPGGCYSGQTCYSHQECYFYGATCANSPSYCIFDEYVDTQICAYVEVCESIEFFYCP